MVQSRKPVMKKNIGNSLNIAKMSKLQENYHLLITPFQLALADVIISSLYDKGNSIKAKNAERKYVSKKTRVCLFSDAMLFGLGRNKNLKISNFNSFSHLCIKKIELFFIVLSLV